MIDFDFVSPTKIYFGKGKERQIGNICGNFSYKKALIVIGQGSVKNSGLLELVTTSLIENEINFKIIEGVRPNPQIELCRDGVVLAKEYKPDVILAVGGGSVIDTAKSIAVGYYYDGDTFDFNLHKVSPKIALPIGVILTISAAGSELSSSCVIQDDKSGTKMGFNSDLIRPVFAIENPELTYSVSKTQTAYGIVDIMMHTLERYFQPSSDNEPADGFAETVLRSVIGAGRKVMDNPNDYESRSVLMLMSSFSHNDLTNLGKKKGMPVHQLENCLSGMYPHVAHAAGLAVLFPAWARYYFKYDVDKFDKLAKNVFNCFETDKYVNAQKGIEELEKFFIFMSMPRTYKDLGIENIDINGLVNKLTNNGTRVVDHHVKPLDKDVALEIFNSCI
mgnify:CR=1 FL=1